MRKTGKPHSFLRGAMILTLGVIAVKIMGALFKIPLNWIIEEDGMGYFTTAYSFYSPIYSLATAGFPVAISRMVSLNSARGRYHDVRQIHRVSIPVFLSVGVLGFIMILAGSGFYVRAMGNEDALPAMLVLAPAILFSCMASIYRGYYEGLRNMAPTAVSEMIEALCRLLFGLCASAFLLQTGLREYELSGTVFGTPAASLEQARALALPWAAAGAIGGVTVGTAAGVLYLFLRHRMRGDGISAQKEKRSPPPLSFRKTAKILLKTALPIGLGAVAVNIAGLVDTTFLQVGVMGILSHDSAALLKQYEGMIPVYHLENPETIPNFLFGCYANAHTLFMLIPAVTQAFGVSALPNVTAAWGTSNPRALQKSMESVLRMTALFSFPAGIGMAVLSGPIVSLLFGSRAAAPIIARLLPIMAAGAVFASISTPLQSMLQAVGRMDIPLKLLGVGLLLKAGLNFWLTSIPELNILGAAVGTLSCYVLIAVGSFVALQKVTGLRLRLSRTLLRPLAAACVCGAAAYGGYQALLRWFTDSPAITLGAIALAGVCYVLSLFLLGVPGREELEQLPGGQKISKLLAKRDGIE